MKIEFKVLETPCWPNAWFGGPVWNGEPKSHATCYYFKTAEEAQANVDRMKALRSLDTKAGG